MSKCLHCGLEVGSRAKYCNDAHRMAYKRNPNSQPEQTRTFVRLEPEQASTRTPEPEQGQVRELHANCVQPQAEWDGSLVGRTDQQLKDRMIPMRQWQGSQEYAEVCHRLTHEQIPNNQPCWLRAQLKAGGLIPC